MPREVIFGNTVTVRRGDLPPATDDPRDADELRRTRPFLAWLGRYLATTTTAGPADDPLAAVAARFHQLVDQLAVVRAGEPTADLPTEPSTPPTDYPELDDLVARLRAERDQLRRRHQLLAQFVDVVRDADDAAGTGGLGNVLRTGLRTLRAELDRVPLDPAADPTGDETTDEPADETTDAPTLAAAFARPRAFRRDGEPEPGSRPDDPAALPCGCYEGAHATGGECPGDLVRVRLALELSWVRDGGVVTARVTGFDEDTSEPLDVGGWALDLDWAGANRAIKKFRVARDQSHGTPE